MCFWRHLTPAASALLLVFLVTAWFPRYAASSVGGAVSSRVPAGEGQVYWAYGGVALSRASGLQGEPKTAGDGHGGMIVAWSDCRIAADDCDIYAQRIDREGNVLWAADGVAVSVAPGNQLDPHIVPDGAAGAIVAWSDYRSPANLAVFAQRLNDGGAPVWPTDGITVTAGSGDFLLDDLVADGSGGAFVVWEQRGAGETVDTDLYAQRLAPGGSARWSTPTPVCAAPGEQYGARASQDGAGGLIVAWADLRSMLDPNIYAQRVSATGETQWTLNGAVVSADPGLQRAPLRVVADGTGGATVAWTDYRANARRSDIVAQRLNAAGQPAWAADRGIFAGQGLSENLTDMIADAAGGVIVIGSAYPEVAADIDVLAQRVDRDGAALWGEQPLTVTPWGGQQDAAVAVADGAGGAYVAWIDTYTDVGTYDIWTQHVSPEGVRLWPDHGVEAIGLTGPQIAPAAVDDGLSGMLVAWQDGRSDPDSPDIYAQRVGDALHRYTLPALWYRSGPGR